MLPKTKKTISIAVIIGISSALSPLTFAASAPKPAVKTQTTQLARENAQINATLKLMSAQISSQSAHLAPGQHTSGQVVIPGSPNNIWGYTGQRLTKTQIEKAVNKGLIKGAMANIDLTSSACSPVVMDYTFYHKVTNLGVTWYEVSDQVIWQFTPYGSSTTTVDSALAGESANWPYQTTGNAQSQYGEMGNGEAYANAEGQFYQFSNSWTGPARSGYAYLNATFNQSTVYLQWIDGFNPNNDSQWTHAWDGPWPC